MQCGTFPHCKISFLMASTFTRILPLVLTVWLTAASVHGAALSKVYSSLSTGPLVTASGYSIPSGTSLTVTLGYAPPTGKYLTVIHNTGSSYIQGAYTNLPQGATVDLTFNGTVFPFVVNYYGGSSGRDLVLEWGSTRLVAWGANNNGSLGTGSFSNSVVPVPVVSTGVLSGRHVIAMAVSSGSSFALCADGTLTSWGSNGNGTLGDGTTTNRFAPVAVDQTGVLAGKRVVALAAGIGHGLGLCSDGTLASWGYNASGQLGNQSQVDSPVPVMVTKAGTALSGKFLTGIAASDQGSLVLSSDGRIFTWGNGPLGNGTTDSLVPVLVGSYLKEKKVAALGAGHSHMVVATSDKYLYSWGGNNNGGVLGHLINSYPAVNYPNQVLTFGTGLAGKTPKDISGGYGHTLVLTTDGSLFSWGQGNKTPVPVNRTNTDLDGRRVDSAYAMPFGGLGLCTDGTLLEWSTGSLSPVSVNMSFLAPGEKVIRAMAGGLAGHRLAQVARPVPVPVVNLYDGSSVSGTPRGNDQSRVEFPNTQVGSSSAVQVFTIRNTGTVDLVPVVQVRAGTGFAGDFTISTTGMPASLTPGASASFTVAFSPAVVGTRDAVVEVVTNDPYTPSFGIPVRGFTQSVAFETSSRALPEDALTISIPVRMNTAINEAFTIPYSVTGSALAGEDFTALSGTLKFAANQTQANILVPIKDDLLVEGDNTLILTLGAPSTAHVVLGGAQVFTLTIAEDDVAPVIAPVAPSQIVAVGDPVLFASGATGSNPLTFSWKKNGAVIAGAVTGVLNVTPSATLGDAASYLLTVANQRSKVTQTSELAVVDLSGQFVRAEAGGSASMTVFAAGPNVRYEWRDSAGTPLVAGSKFAGVTTKTLTVKSLTPIDSTTFTCRVYTPAGSKISGVFELQIPTQPPALMPLAFPDCVAFNSYRYVIPVDTTFSMAPTRFVCTGLPAGLTCNAATGVVSGKPSRTGTFNISVKVSNKAGDSALLTDQMTVVSYPSGAVGTYVGYMSRQPLVNSSLGGRIDLTTTAKGDYTCTLRLGGTAYLLKGAMITSPVPGSHPGVVISVARKGLLPVVVSLDIDPLDNSLAGSAHVKDDPGMAALTGWRNTWRTSAPVNAVSAQLGLHVFHLQPLIPSVPGEPQGHGYGSITIKNTGSTAVAGRTADGGSFTTSGWLGPQFELLVFQSYSTNQASLLGELTVSGDADHTVAGTLQWQRTLPAASARDYRPFGPMLIGAAGGRYVVEAPALGATDTPVTTPNALLQFAFAGIESSATSPNISVRISSTNALSIPAAIANPAQITKLSLVGSSGLFSGRMTLTDGPVVRKDITFQGQILPTLGLGVGWFLLPQLPDPLASPPTTPTTSPILSGRVVLSIP